MRYLLDVNTLLVLVVLEHEFHARVASWVERLGASGVPELATCSITELGFVRVLGQAQQYGSSIAQAREFLLKVKNSDGISWISFPMTATSPISPSGSELQNKPPMGTLRTSPGPPKPF
jgi:predicted nucleic acid-binding protein